MSTGIAPGTFPKNTSQKCEQSAITRVIKNAEAATPVFEDRGKLFNQNTDIFFHAPACPASPGIIHKAPFR
jgi:hypothetical protein